MQAAMRASALGDGTSNALRQALSLSPPASEIALSVVPRLRTAALISSRCTSPTPQNLR